MAFPFALSRMILLFVIIVTNAVSSVLSAIAFHETAGQAFQILAFSISVLTPLTVIGCLCHQLVDRDDETSNTRNICLFGICGMLGSVLAILLTVHALHDHNPGLCNDFTSITKSCVPAGVQLGMAYGSSASAFVGCIISWIDKYPGAVKVTARDPVMATASSSQLAAHAYDLDGNYTSPPPMKTLSKSRNNAKWNDVPSHC